MGITHFKNCKWNSELTQTSIDIFSKSCYCNDNRPTTPLPQGTRNPVGILFWGQNAKV
jgi:hypothetical protein